MTTGTSFREQAEKRIRELEAREHDRQVRAEQLAAEQRAGQQELRERREQAQRDADERAAAEARTRLVRAHGQQAADRVNLSHEYWAFSCPARGVVVAIGRPPGSTSKDNWRHQQRLQRVLGVGFEPPRILVGAQLAEAADADGLGLLVDPADPELRSSP